MKLEIITPEEHLGEVLGDVNGREEEKSKRLRPREAAQLVHADVPSKRAVWICYDSSSFANERAEQVIR